MARMVVDCLNFAPRITLWFATFEARAHHTWEVRMGPKLTAEAFGTLLALVELHRLRVVEPKIENELVERGFATRSGAFLIITPAARCFTQTCTVEQALGLTSRAA